MWIINIVILLIIAITAIFQFKKSTLFKSWIFFVILICSSVLAFNYYELLSSIFHSRTDGYLATLAPWASTISFLLIAIISFALLQTIAGQLTKIKVDLGTWPEQIGRPLFGLFSGMMIAGILLIGLGLSPLSAKYPYPRFTSNNLNPAKPAKPILSADGFVTSWANSLSSKSFSSKQSLAVLHPQFLNEIYLNRFAAKDKVEIFTSKPAITLSKGQVYKAAPENLKNTEGEIVESRQGYNLTVVSFAIKQGARKAYPFTLSQVQLCCKNPQQGEQALEGEASAEYPIGILQSEDTMVSKGLSDVITIDTESFKDSLKWFDFVFYVPSDSQPTLIKFKQNNIELIPKTGGQESAVDSPQPTEVDDANQQ